MHCLERAPKLLLGAFIPLISGACILYGCSDYNINVDNNDDDKCQQHINAEEWSEAIACLNRQITENPDNSASWAWRAYCYEQIDNHHKAIADATKALALDPDADWAFDTRASAYRGLKLYNQCISDYSEEIKLKPNDADRYVDRADCFDDMKQFKNAIADYDKALQLDNNSTAALNNRGWTYLEQGQYQKAIEDFDACLEQDEKYSNAYFNRSAAFMHLGKENEALIDLKKVLEQDNSEYRAYLDRGAIYLAKDEPEKALSEFELASDTSAETAGKVWGNIYRYLTLKAMQKNADAQQLLRETLQEAESSDWPYAIALYLADRMPEKQLFVLSSTDEERTAAHGVIAINEQLSHNKSKAHEHFVWLKEHSAPSERVLFIAMNALKDPSFLLAKKPPSLSVSQDK